MMKDTRPPALEIHDLVVTYHRKPVLHGVDLTLVPGTLVGIMGPNGAGKSTLIKAVMGLLPVQHGWVNVFGKPAKQSLRRVGYVPQRESVDWDFPVNALDVVLMGRYGKLGLWRRPGKADREIARRCLAKVGMETYADRQIGALSGGQQQRVFLARALAQESDLYLMDEPFAGVDAATEQAIVAVMRDLRAEGRTLVVVHHDLTSARDYFDTLVLLNLRVVAHGPMASTFTAENLRKAYGGRLNLFSELADERAAMER
jgi:manganese/zinc/iron transport system ATP- binding protein